MQSNFNVVKPELNNALMWLDRAEMKNDALKEVIKGWANE